MDFNQIAEREVGSAFQDLVHKLKEAAEAELRDVRRTLEQDLDTIRRQADSLREELETESARAAALEADLDSVIEAHRTVDGERVKAEAEIHGLAGRLDAARREVTQLQESLESEAALRALLEADLSSTRDSLSAAEATIRGLESNVRSLESSVATLHGELQQARAKADEQLKELRLAADAQVRDARSAADQQVQDARAAADAQVEEVRAAAALEAEQARAEAAARIDEVRAEAEAQLRQVREAGETRLQEIQALADARAGELEALRTTSEAQVSEARAEAEARARAIEERAAGHLYAARDEAERRIREAEASIEARLQAVRDEASAESRTALESAQAQLDQVRAEADAKVREIQDRAEADLRDARAQGEAKVEEARQSADAALEELRLEVEAQLRDVRAQADAEIRELTARAEADLEAARNDAEAQIREAQEAARQHEDRAAELTVRLSSSRDELAAAREQLTAIKASAEASGSALDGRDELIASLQAQLAAAREAERTLQASFEALQASADDARSVSLRLRDEANAEAARLAEAVARAEAAETATRLAEDELATLRARPDTGAAMLQASSRALEALAGSPTVADLMAGLARQLAPHFGRVAIFRVKGNHLEGEQGAGLDRATDVTKLSIPLGLGSPISRAATTRTTQVMDLLALADEPTPLGGAPSAALAIPVIFQGETFAVTYVDCPGEIEPVAAAFAALLAGQASVLLGRLSQEMKLMKELRDYAALLVQEAEQMFVADVEGGRPEADRRRRLSETIECARQLFAQRAALDGPAAARALDDYLMEVMTAPTESAFAADLTAILGTGDGASARKTG